MEEQLDIKANDGKSAINAAIDPYKSRIVDVLFKRVAALS